MSVKVFNNPKNIYEEINRFPNGDKTQHLTSVDIEETFRSGRCCVNIPEGFSSDKLEYNPFGRVFIDMTERRNKFRKEYKNKLQTFPKK